MTRTLLIGLTATFLAIPARGQEPFEFDRRTPVVQVVERFGDCVLSVSTIKRTIRGGNDPFSRFFGTPQPTSGIGSGVVIDPTGYVITNAHVVHGADEIRVRMLDGRELVAELLSSDPANDLALLKIESDQPFDYVPLGNSEDLMIGETVIALGNPYGLSNTVTTGVLSATNRSVPTSSSNQRFEDFLQTDASINPGNSGGALLNINGELIGINTAILQHGQGIGFAIPVDRVRKVLPNLLDLPLARGLSIGVEFETVTNGSERDKIVVTEIEPDTRAATIGLKPGDVVTRVDGQLVTDLLDLKKKLLEKKAGDVLELSVLRGSSAQDLALPVESIEELTRKRFLRRFGFWGESRLYRTRGGTIRGFEITEVRPSSPADELRLQKEDVIVKLQWRQYRDTRYNENSITAERYGLFEALRAICEHSRDGEQLQVDVLRRGEPRPLTGPLIVGE